MNAPQSLGARVALVLAALTVFLPGHSTAFAAMSAAASATPTVSSASWGAAAAASGAVPTAQAHVLVWVGGTAVHYFEVVNTGSTSLLSITWSVSNVAGGTGVTPDITFDACVGGSWNAATAACSSGRVQRIGATKKGALSVTSSATPAEPGSRLSMRALTSNSRFPSSFTTNISLSVSRDQAQLPETISS